MALEQKKIPQINSSQALKRIDTLYGSFGKKPDLVEAKKKFIAGFSSARSVDKMRYIIDALKFERPKDGLFYKRPGVIEGNRAYLLVTLSQEKNLPPELAKIVNDSEKMQSLIPVAMESDLTVDMILSMSNMQVLPQKEDTIKNGEFERIITGMQTSASSSDQPLI